MYFKGTIVITDPCYIIKENPIKHPKPEDFNLPASINSKKFTDYETPDEFAYKAACEKYYEEYPKHDDWERCYLGERMGVLGFHNYFTKPTIYGDWDCTTYQVEGNPKEFVEKFEKELKNIPSELELEGKMLTGDVQLPDAGKNIGKFCSDAGLVSVFLLDEILAYNLSWSKWIEKSPWCATIIKDFEGEVEYYRDSIAKDAHIVGEGNINFYTTQTGL